MGANQSTTEFSSAEVQQFAQQYTRRISNYDFRFGQMSLYQNNLSNQFVLLTSKHFTNDAERNIFANEVRNHQAIVHPSILKTIGYSLEKVQTLCGQQSVANVYTEFYQDDLLRELQIREKTKERYSEQEIQYLLQTLVAAFAYLQENNIYHGDIHPQNVILNQSGQAKIFDNAILGQYRNNFIRRLQGQTNLYLAPEILDAISRQVKSPQYNAFQADVYSLGITFLYICLLHDPVGVYNYSDNRVNHDQIDILLNHVLTHYSFQLTDIIRQMLMQDPAKRPSFIELRGLVGYRPAVQQPLVQQPLVQQPVVQQPVVQQPVVQQPLLASQPLVQQPFVQQPVVQQPFVQQPLLASQPLVQQPFVQQPLVQQPLLTSQYQQPHFVNQPNVQGLRNSLVGQRPNVLLR